MSTTNDAIEWLRPFHEAAGGRTGDALDAAMSAVGEAPEHVRLYAIREGFRLGLHSLRRTQTIRVNGDAETMPLFVATEDDDGVVVHRMRSLVTVAEIARQITRWGERREQAGRELTWWTHQRDLARQGNAEPTETLRGLWDRLGVPYELFVGDDQAEAI